jgi:hypothetical protein
VKISDKKFNSIKENTKKRKNKDQKRNSRNKNRVKKIIFCSFKSYSATKDCWFKLKEDATYEQIYNVN